MSVYILMERILNYKNYLLFKLFTIYYISFCYHNLTKNY